VLSNSSQGIRERARVVYGNYFPGTFIEPPSCSRAYERKAKFSRVLIQRGYVKTLGVRGDDHADDFYSFGKWPILMCR
jgi:hypothetical protein